MRLARSEKIGSSVVQGLVSAFSLGCDEYIDTSLMDVSREFFLSSSDATEAAWFYQQASLFSKFDNGVISPERASRALAKAAAAEVSCREANERLIDIFYRPCNHRGVLKRARRIIHDVLGRFPWESFPRACRFGPGASTGVRKRHAHAQNKWVQSAHITEKAVPYYAAFRRWAGIPDLPAKLQLVEGNRVTTVPKTYKIDRTIAIEPDWNMFFQLGVGALIRRRLNRLGILLPNAQEQQRALARQGSIDGYLATLDLSAASDSISLALVAELLPPDWTKVLIDLRSGKYWDEDVGAYVTYEKISSMGNGYTFELETLIFYALARACMRNGEVSDVSVFGDDIICPGPVAAELTEVLSFCGFGLNLDKSFVTGPFRESCGGHYHGGRDITPIFLKHFPDEVGDLIVLHNGMEGWIRRTGVAPVGWKDVRQLLRRGVPKVLRGPRSVAGCLHSEWDETTPKWERNTQTWKVHTAARKRSEEDLGGHVGALLHKLWVGSPDHTPSSLTRADKWVTSTTSVGPDSWDSDTAIPEWFLAPPVVRQRVIQGRFKPGSGMDWTQDPPVKYRVPDEGMVEGPVSSLLPKRD